MKLRVWGLKHKYDLTSPRATERCGVMVPGQTKVDTPPKIKLHIYTTARAFRGQIAWNYCDQYKGLRRRPGSPPVAGLRIHTQNVSDGVVQDVEKRHNAKSLVYM